MPVPTYPSDEPEQRENPNDVIDSVIDKVIGGEEDDREIVPQ